MAKTATTKTAPAKAASTAKPAPKRNGGPKKKLTAYNKFMKAEMARLKEADAEQPHPERFKQATANWATAKENPKASK